jgi:hypothetical protein
MKKVPHGAFFVGIGVFGGFFGLARILHIDGRRKV